MNYPFLVQCNNCGVEDKFEQKQDAKDEGWDFVATDEGRRWMCPGCIHDLDNVKEKDYGA